MSNSNHTSAPTPPARAAANASVTQLAYWAFADWAMTVADDLWSESTGFYGSDIRTSAAMLAAHSIAAQLGYTGGPTRNDARAKRMADRRAPLPTYGSGAEITAVMNSGSRVAMKKGDAAVSLGKVAYFWLRSAGNETG